MDSSQAIQHRYTRSLNHQTEEDIFDFHEPIPGKMHCVHMHGMLGLQDAPLQAHVTSPQPTP